VTALRPTVARLDLMRTIAANVVRANRDGAQKICCWIRAVPAFDGRTRNRLNELIVAGLVEDVPWFTPKLQPVQVTEAGRLWLAEHDKET
jgi:hypothetical protein